MNNHIGDANKMVGAAQEVVAWSKTKPTTEGAYYVRGFAIGQDVALVQVRMHRFDGEPAPELVCNIHESTSNEDMDDWWPMVDLSDDFEWLGPLVAAPVAAAPNSELHALLANSTPLREAAFRALGFIDRETSGGEESYRHLQKALHDECASTPAAPVDLSRVHEFLLHVRKCLDKNGEYAPLSRSELDGAIAAIDGDAEALARVDAFTGRTPAAPGIDLPADYLPVHVSCIADIEKVGVRCLDSGTCHHQCKDKCFRKNGCVPLGIAGSYLNDDWTLKQGDASPKGGSTDMRTEFELRFGKAYPMGRYQNSPDTYSFMETRRVWEGWQAAMQATSAEVGV